MASKKSKSYVKRSPLTEKRGSRKTSDIAGWETEFSHFQSAKQKLVEDGTYLNKYVAIKNKKIIDSDKNEIRLVRRINKTYPDEVVFIAKVDEKESIGVVRSPRVAK